MQLKLPLLLMTTAVVFFSFVTNIVFGQATVETDLPDYSPGQVVTISGTNWHPGETVSINILSDCGCENFTYYVTAAADSTIFHTGFTLSTEHLGIGFTVTATGQTSLQVAKTTFHDAITIWSNPITSNGINPNTSNPYTTGDIIYTNANITVSGIGMGTGTNGATTNNRYNASGWNSSSLNTNDYYNFTITPNAGYHINYNNFIYAGQTSPTGPINFAFRSNIAGDNFATDIGTPTAAGATIALNTSTYSNITGAIEFRLYGWNASSAVGTFSVNDFTFGGAILGTSVPSLNGFSTCVSTASTAQSFTVNGVGLTPNSTITIAASANYELSTTSAVAGFQGTGSVTLNTDAVGAVSGTVWVRLKANVTPGNYNGEIINVSGGGFVIGDNINVSVSGTVDGPAVILEPVSSIITYGLNTSFTVTASGAPTLTYQWQEKVGAGSFTNITNAGVYSDATTATLTLTKPGVLMSSNQYRCVVTNGCGSVNSDGNAILTINAKALTASTIVASKVYDGSAVTGTVTLGAVTGLVGSETLVITPTASDYADKNVGADKATTIAYGLADGTNGLAVNYSMANLATSGVITARDVNVTAQADSKTYDGDNSSSVSPEGDALQGTDSYISEGTQSYDTKHVGTGKTLTASGASINDGNSGSNYEIHYVTNTSGVIEQKSLTVRAVNDTKIYNGTISSGATPSVGALAAGDVVNTSTQVYDNRNVGNTHVLTVSAFTIKDGSNADVTANYDINYLPSPATGVISIRSVAVTAKTDTKVYDGNNSSDESPTVTGIQTGDVIQTAPTQTYDDEFVGTGKTMSASGLIINDGNSGNNYNIGYVQDFTGVITLATTTSTLITSAPSVRYMDNLTMTARITPLNTGSALTGSVEFRIGTSFATATPYGSAAVVPIPGSLNGTVEATLIKQVTNLPAGYTVYAVFSSTNTNYDGSSATKPLTVVTRNADPYDAKGFYTGDVFAWTTDPNSSKGTLTMTAMIKDKNLPKGDLRGAKVTFCYVNNGVWSPIPSAKDIPVGLVDINDGSVGFASAIVQFDIGSQNAANYQVGVLVTGAYSNETLKDCGLSQVIVSVSKPISGGFICGGSRFVNPVSTQPSAGYIKGAPGLCTDYQFDIQYTKSGTNPKGKVKVMINSYYKADGVLDDKLHTYIITTNAIASMVATAPVGTFSAKANLVEQVGETIVAIEGGSIFQMVAYQCGADQKIAITLHRKAGGIWFSSSWDGTKTVEKPVATGSKVYVDGGGSCTPSSAPSARINTAVNSTQVDVAPTINFGVKASPNPTTSQFNVKLESPDSKTPMIVRVVDLSGKVIEVRRGLMAEQTVQLGTNYRPGMYFIELTQGNQKRIVKVVKQPD